MKQKIINNSHVEGYLYQYKLEAKVSGPNSAHPGVNYIAGTIDIATNEKITNIIQIHFTYVIATTSKGMENNTYTILKNMIGGMYKTIMNSSKAEAAKIRIDSNLSLNEWYSKNKETGKDELVSIPRNEGGFIHIVNDINVDEKQRNTFDTDIILYGTKEREGDPDKGTSDRLDLKGYIFNFRGELMPIEYTAINPAAIDYFNGLEISKSNPVFTRLKGRQICESIMQPVTIEGAFGSEVREYSKTNKAFVVTWAAPNPYEWDSEDTILASELVKKLSERENTLAVIKQRQEEYQASKNANAIPSADTETDSKGQKFNF